MTEAAGWRVQDAPGPVRSLTLDNPRKRNALDGALLDQLERLLTAPESQAARVLILRGGKESFSAGYDVRSLPQASAAPQLPDERLGQVMDTLQAHPAVTLAVVEGPAFGAGCELACACDFRLGGPGAVFSLTPARLGIIYAPRGLARIARHIGTTRAKRMALLAERVEAPTALAWGLLDGLFEGERLEEEVSRWCAELLRGAPLAVAGMKQLLGAFELGPLGEEQGRAIAAERRRAYHSEDAAEGRAAFLEKRTPRFTGR